LQSACPKKIASNVKDGGPAVRSARDNACSIEVGDDRQCSMANYVTPSNNDKTTLLKVQVNRCVVEVPVITDEGDKCAYA